MNINLENWFRSKTIISLTDRKTRILVSSSFLKFFAPIIAMFIIYRNEKRIWTPIRFISHWNSKTDFAHFRIFDNSQF